MLLPFMVWVLLPAKIIVVERGGDEDQNCM